MSLRDKLPPEEVAAARQRYAITRAAEVLRTSKAFRASAAFGVPGEAWVDAATRMVEALDAAGWLVSPEHDRKVAAHTFRWAADQMEPAGPPLPGAMRHGWSAAVKTLRDLADESDRNAGERDE